MAQMKTLPTELLILVLQGIPWPYHSNLHLVCRLWRDIIENDSFKFKSGLYWRSGDPTHAEFIYDVHDGRFGYTFGYIKIRLPLLGGELPPLHSFFQDISCDIRFPAVTHRKHKHPLIDHEAKGKLGIAYGGRMVDQRGTRDWGIQAKQVTMGRGVYVVEGGKLTARCIIQVFQKRGGVPLNLETDRLVVNMEYYFNSHAFGAEGQHSTDFTLRKPTQPSLDRPDYITIGDVFSALVRWAQDVWLSNEAAGLGGS